MTVRPFVVADGIDECALKSLQLRQGLIEDFVTARNARRFNVTDVQGKGGF